MEKQGGRMMLHALLERMGLEDLLDEAIWVDTWEN